jgi:post-segregation antitoxin (ccd killing protein)
VYSVRMARVNIYLPDDLADASRGAGLSVSTIAQAALRQALVSRSTDEWLDRVARLQPARVTHREAMAALEAARSELDSGRG